MRYARSTIRLLFLALLVAPAAGVVPVAAHAAPAAADVGAPSWWNGDCDANNWNTKAAAAGWTGAGAHRLGASYLGVPVCGPRPGSDGAPNILWSRSGWGHLEWQCPELAFRFMAQLYGVSAYGANGGDVVGNYTPAAGGGLVKVNNGTPGKPPVAGDVISFTNPGAPGHTAVVTASNVNGAGNGTVTLMSQNDTADGWRTLTVAGWNVQGFGTYTPYGWLHDPLGRGSGGPPPVEGRLHPLTPTRILDSRDGTGGYTTPWGSVTSRTLVVAGTGGVPANASAVLLNVTVTHPDSSSYLTVWPAGQPRPTASNLNWPAGDTRPNLVLAKLGLGGAVWIYNHAGAVNVVADVEGWYDDGSVAAGETLFPLSPTRILDSRDGTGGHATPWDAGVERALTVAGAGGVPGDADAVVLNVTATDTTDSSFLTVWPAGQPMPTASNLNWPPGATRPNLVVVKLGTGGAVSIYNHSGATNVVADVVGYFRTASGGAATAALTPTRILDSRDGTGGYSTPWTWLMERSIAVAGVAGVPADATAVILNVTVTNATGGSYLTVFPKGQGVPLASNLNFVADSTVPNLVLVPVGASGRVSIFNHNGNVDVVADVVGYAR